MDRHSHVWVFAPSPLERSQAREDLKTELGPSHELFENERFLKAGESEEPP